MAYDIIMPKAGMAMETGKILRWIKQTGDTVEVGDSLLEIETDKVSMEVEAINSGVLLAQLYGPGEDIPVTTVIGYIGKEGESIPEAASPKSSSIPEPATKAEEHPVASSIQDMADRGKVRATPKAKRLAEEAGVDISDIAGSGPHGAVVARDVSVKASPLARKIALDVGAPIREITGTGHAGKVLADDVRAYAAGQVASEGRDLAVTMTGMRKTVAARMSQSHQEIPPVTMHTQADVTDLLALRTQINASGDVKITVNDFVLYAVALALKKHPRMNAAWVDGGIVEKGHINVGMAVALDDGLIVPVIKDAAALSLSGMSKRAKELSKKARDGALKPDEYTGGTFTVSNLGMLGIESFTPIINQPEAGILGVCAILDRFVPDHETGGGRWAKSMGLSITFDHRIIDGAQCAKFLQDVVRNLENPLGMLI